MRRQIAMYSFALVSLIAVACSHADAASLNERLKIDSWTVEAYTQDQSQRFSHCAMYATYKSGISLIFAIDRDFKWRMGFWNTAWALQSGSDYQVAYWIDAGTPITAKARALNGTTAYVELEPTHALFERFRKGAQLKVSAANQIFQFNLTSTAKALDATYSCTQRHVLQATTSRPGNDPFAPAPTAGVHSAEFTSEAAVLTANLLSRSGVEGFYIIPKNEVPTQFATYDAVWVAPNVVGTVKVVLSNIARSPQDISSALISSDAQTCKGSFASGVIPDRNSPAISTFTGCQGTDAWSIYYSILPRKVGGFYVLGAIATGANGQPAKAASDNIRAAAATVIR
jgi:hypothetical protein